MHIFVRRNEFSNFAHFIDMTCLIQSRISYYGYLNLIARCIYHHIRRIQLFRLFLRLFIFQLVLFGIVFDEKKNLTFIFQWKKLFILNIFGICSLLEGYEEEKTTKTRDTVVYLKCHVTIKWTSNDIYLAVSLNWIIFCGKNLDKINYFGCFDF